MSSDGIEDVVFRAGEALFEEHEESFHFFVIQSGQVEIYKTGPDAQKIPLAVINPGVSIGEIAMLDGHPRSATARALTVVHASKVSADVYQQLISELPDWAIAVMKGLVERVRHNNETIRRSGIVDRQLTREIKDAEFDGEGYNLEEDDNPDLA